MQQMIYDCECQRRLSCNCVDALATSIPTSQDACRPAFSWALVVTLLFLASNVVFVNSSLPSTYEPRPSATSLPILVEMVAVVCCGCEVLLRWAAAKTWRQLATDSWLIIAAVSTVPMFVYGVRSLACVSNCSMLTTCALRRTRTVCACTAGVCDNTHAAFASPGFHVCLLSGHARMVSWLCKDAQMHTSSALCQARDCPKHRSAPQLW